MEDITLKIDNSTKSVSPQSRVEKTTPKKGSAGASKTAPKSTGSQERVDIGPLSAQLQSLESSLENVQVVDTARVEAIKQAITEGRFRVNPDVVADRLLTTVKELVLNHKG
ncbi:MAG: flagellar biosynthesis anti-sigma factor FlgM [Burkholderiales bacterium]|nr:flagellar biosynthesis anti-sigma factor FlgM [Burkholderiales bacterium]